MLDALTGPFEKVAPTNRVTPMAGTVASGSTWALSGATNDAFNTGKDDGVEIPGAKK